MEAEKTKDSVPDGDGLVEVIENIRQEAIKELESCSDPNELEQIRIKYLGRKSGQLTRMSRGIGSLSPQLRKDVGKAAGLAQIEITRRIDAIIVKIEKGAKEFQEAVDITLPGRKRTLGKRHPLTVVTDRIVQIFTSMGFSVADGPEVETEYYNFDALNTPPDHPARDTRDTFYILSPIESTGDLLLRTETSPVQIRVMEKTSPPVRIISPGRVYRKDTSDATHHFIFHQVEGLYVDNDVTFGDLKGVISVFARKILGEDVKVRFRPHFFPFTEPSAEYDFSCVLCDMKGCSVCKGTGWIEIAGCGMVDPEVFRAVGYDPEVWTGYAFGMGIERVAMVKYGIDDIRLFLESDLRFISQF